MLINDDVSKLIKLTEKTTTIKNSETFQMDPFYEINSQFAHYVLLDTHYLWSNYDNYCLENKIKKIYRICDRQRIQIAVTTL